MNSVEDAAIVVAVGGNLPHPDCGSAQETCRAALRAMAARGVTIAACSRFYETAPVPPSDQPRFVNAVAAVDTRLGAADLLGLLHAVEAEFGRVRRLRNEARVLDLDLIAYGRHVSEAGEWPELPHPRMHERGFVLIPMRDILPGWRHPIRHATIADMIAALPEPLGVTALP